MGHRSVFANKEGALADGIRAPAVAYRLALAPAYLELTLVDLPYLDLTPHLEAVSITVRPHL